MGTSLLLQRTQRSDIDAPSFGMYFEDEIRLIPTRLKKTLLYLLTCHLVFATIPTDDAWSQSAQPEISSNASTSPGQNSHTGQGAPLTTQEIDSLVSPIALYPDALVAQVLAAATFPDQIAVANYWLQQNKSLTGSALMQSVDKSVVGSERKGTDAIPNGVGQPGPESFVDLPIGRCIPQSAVRSDVGRSGLAGAGKDCGQSEDHAAANCNNQIAKRNASDRHSTGESPGGLRSDL
jgi:hypothetical protein